MCWQIKRKIKKSGFNAGSAFPSCYIIVVIKSGMKILRSQSTFAVLAGLKKTNNHPESTKSNAKKKMISLQENNKSVVLAWPWEDVIVVNVGILHRLLLFSFQRYQERLTFQSFHQTAF